MIKKKIINKKPTLKKKKKKYQVGGEKDQYADNVIPGSYNPTTAHISAQQSDPAITASLMERQNELGKEADLTGVTEDGKARAQRTDAGAQTILGLGKTFAKSSNTLKAGKDVAKAVGTYSKSAEELSHLASIPGVDQGINTVSGATQTTGTLASGAQAFKGAKAVGATGKVALKAGVTAAGWAGPQAVGMVASEAGKAIEKKYDDDDVTTMNAGETTGKLVKGAGYGATAAGIAGSLGAFGTTMSWNPVGWAALAAAAVAGGIGLHQRNKGRKAVAKEERTHDLKQRKITAEMNAEETKRLTTTGYDFGNNLGMPGAMGSEQMRRKTGGVRYQNGGPLMTSNSKALPGGQAVPIPGSDAVEYVGQTHKEGGIMVDPTTEVENRETGDGVTMSDGKQKEYFFSDYLKHGGTKSFADKHKEVIASGGTQQDIDRLAAVQEGEAGRDPNKIQVAQTGGPKNINELEPREQIFHKGLQNAKDTQRKYTEDGKNMSFMQRLDRQFGNADFWKSPYNREMDYTRQELSQYDEAQSKAGKGVPFTKMQEGGFDTSDEEYNTLNLQEDQLNPNFFNRAKAFASEKIGNYRDGKSERQLNRAINGIDRDVPTAALLAGAGQMIPALYAFKHKEKDAKQVSKAGRVKAPDLDRVNFNAERAGSAAQGRARSRAITNSGAGPGGIAAMMASHSAKSTQDMQIASAEARANTAIGNQEAQMKMQASSQNVANDLRVDTMNTQINEAQRIAEEDSKREALDVGFKNIAGISSDVLQYKAAEREARALGSHGIYERDKLRTSLRGVTNPATGKVYTDGEIALLVSQLKTKE